MFSSFRRWLKKRHAANTESVRTPPEPEDDDMVWFHPPCDVHNHTVWDSYWQDQVTHGLTPPLFDMFCHDDPLIECLIMRGAKTLLCAGSGISQEPRALAAAGFEVIAMDLSPRAMHLAETWQFSPMELDRFFSKELRATGGTVRFVSGDILDCSVCPGPFDAIIERRMLQLFPSEERGIALDMLASRLRSDGLFLSHCHDGRWRPPGKPVHQVEKFFRDRGWTIRFCETANQVGRVAWLQMSTG